MKSLPSQMSARAVRITGISAAMIIFALHLGQGYVEVSRARASVEELGRTLVESASVAVATPLWVLSEHTVREVLRSLTAHGSVQRAVVYDNTQPALLYEREYGIRGGLQESSNSIADLIDPGTPRSEYTLYRFSRDITFEGDRIGSFEIYLDNRRIVERIWNVVWRSLVFLAGEIAVILLLLRARTARLRAVGLHAEREELENEVGRRQELEEQLRKVAYYDPISGLPSRRAVGREVPLPVIPAGSNLHREVLLISIANLPELSAVLDSKLIDQLIRTFADRLRDQLDLSSDLALRGRGFRFFVVTVIREDEDAQELALRIRKSFRLPVPIGAGSVRLRVHIGMTELDPEEAFDAARKRAEVAVRTTAAMGSSAQIGRYSSRDDETAARRVQLETAMSRSSFLQELSVMYQPIVDLSDGRPVGYEALVRWMHPDYGMISPGEFISPAEENGLILDVGWFVLQEGIALAHHLQSVGDGESPFVSINVSPVQLFQDRFPESIAAELARNGLPRTSIKLEITETSIEDSQDTFWRAAEAFKKAGMAIAIDDFGSGSSAFRRLSEFAFDTLKVDQYFVRGMQHERSLPIIRAVNDLAQASGMGAVVEGIETEDDANLARKAGCRMGQGYLYGRPAPAPELFPDYERIQASTSSKESPTYVS